jgi:hypothetical protein
MPARQKLAGNTYEPWFLAFSRIQRLRMQEEAFEESQKYKEGKSIIEKAKMVKEGDWL